MAHPQASDLFISLLRYALAQARLDHTSHEAGRMQARDEDEIGS
jgi:hypothetical protein